MKKENESFSDVILKAFKYRKKRNLMELAGAWKNNPDVVKIMKDIYKERKKFKLRDVKFD